MGSNTTLFMFSRPLHCLAILQGFEHRELPAKLLDHSLQSNESDINQTTLVMFMATVLFTAILKGQCYVHGHCLIWPHPRVIARLDSGRERGSGHGQNNGTRKVAQERKNTLLQEYVLYMSIKTQTVRPGSSVYMYISHQCIRIYIYMFVHMCGNGFDR